MKSLASLTSSMAEAKRKNAQRSTEFHPGERVLRSGVYGVIHAVHARELQECVLVAGEVFPTCNRCQENVAYVLIHAAPYIREDEDFLDPR